MVGKERHVGDGPNWGHALLMRPTGTAPARHSYVSAMLMPERLRQQSLRNVDPVESSKPPRLTLVHGLRHEPRLLSMTNERDARSDIFLVARAISVSIASTSVRLGAPAFTRVKDDLNTTTRSEIETTACPDRGPARPASLTACTIHRSRATPVPSWRRHRRMRGTPRCARSARASGACRRAAWSHAPSRRAPRRCCRSAAGRCR